MVNILQKPFTDLSLEPVFPPAIYNGPAPRRATLYPGKVLTGATGTAASRFPRDSVSRSALEKADLWDGFENDILPPKQHGRYIRNLRHQVFSVYRRLFSIVFVVNFSIFIAIACHGGASAQRIGLIVMANLSSSIFMRQDYVINAFFILFCAVPLSYVGDPLQVTPVSTTHACEQMAPTHSYNMCTCVPYWGM